MKTIKITLKSLWRRNRGNQIVLLCVTLLALLPMLLYTTVNSVMNRVEESHKSVFGSFSDVYYDELRNGADTLELSRMDMMNLLSGFFYQDYGVFSTVYSDVLSANKKLNVGYADESALWLAETTLTEGQLPVNDNETALTESVAQLMGNVGVGDNVILRGKRYTVSGIVQDFGHLWPKGEEQARQKITPINAFVSENEALRILQDSQFLQRQILILRIDGVSSDSDGDPRLFPNVNTASSATVTFEVPQLFLLLLYAAALVMVFVILLLGSQRTAARIRGYYQLGLVRGEIKTILCAEKIGMLLAGLLAGFALGYGLSLITLRLLNGLVGQELPLIFDWPPIMKLYLALLISLSIIIIAYNAYAVQKAFREPHEKHHRKSKKHKQVRPGGFDWKLHRKSLAAMALLMMFSYTLISCGAYYGAYFKGSLFETPPGRLVMDADFQFAARPLPAAPTEETPVVFTDTLEKIGASPEFIAKLAADPAVKKLKCYRENNKVYVLLQQAQMDNYLDAYDFALDGKYNIEQISGLSQYDVIARAFGYAPDDLLAGAELLGYPFEVLESLERSVVEGKIDRKKIAAGEEVVLRVPTFALEDMGSSDEWESIVSRGPAGENAKDAFISTAIHVGDTITLTSLLTDQKINGGVIESQLSEFRRYDVQVKVGAIIRTAEGLLTNPGNFGRPYSLLTVSEGMDALGLPATYSTVDVYADHARFTDQELTERITQYTADVPTMQLENWQADIKTYRIFNTLVMLFVTVLLSILALTTFAVLTSQLLSKTQMSMRNYALLRINGLPFQRLLRLWLAQLFGVLVIGCVPGVPLSLALIQQFHMKSPFHILKAIFYYFPPIAFSIIFAGMLVVAALAAMPSLLYLWKRRDSILFDVD